jgi:hypothetical protein
MSVVLWTVPISDCTFAADLFSPIPSGPAAEARMTASSGT